MATVNQELLDRALKLGVFADEKAQMWIDILHPTIITALTLKRLISDGGRSGLDLEQLTQRSYLSKNTVLIHCRWMVRHKIIQRHCEGQGGKITYYPYETT